MDRRSFLQAGTASAAAHLLGIQASKAGRVTGDGTSTGSFVIADGRYSDSLAFAQTLATQAAVMLPLRAGLATLWFDALLPLMPSRAAIIGLTLESDRFVLQRLAGDFGMRARYIGLHDWRRKAGSDHVLSGRLHLDPIAGALSRGGDIWAVRLALALSAAGPACADWQEMRIQADIDRAADSPGFLTSWVLMP